VIICLLVVIAGFFIGADAELNFSLRGTLFGVTSSMFVCLNSIFAKRYDRLPGIDGRSAVMSFYNNLNAVVLFIPLIWWMGEVDIIKAKHDVLVNCMYLLLAAFSPLRRCPLSVVGIISFLFNDNACTAIIDRLVVDINGISINIRISEWYR
jgi:drug/metabolite transporter (DMT)-like permease